MVTHVETSRSARSTTIRIEGASVTANEPPAASHEVALTIDDPPPTASGRGLNSRRTGPGIPSPPSTGCSGAAMCSRPHCQSAAVGPDLLRQVVLEGELQERRPDRREVRGGGGALGLLHVPVGQQVDRLL